MLAKVPPGESFSAWRKELELQVSQGIRELDELRAKESKLAGRANRDLTFVQRLFILFPPDDPRLWVVHALAYAFLAVGPLAVLLLVLFGIGDAGRIGDVMVMVVFGALAFRAWALAERKWAMEALRQTDGSDQTSAESGPLQALFVLRKSRGWRMLVAQLCMWTCLFCAGESLEDIFLAAVDASKSATQVAQSGTTTLANASRLEPGHQPLDAPDPAKKARDDARSGLLLFVTSLLGAGICRAWAAAEWRHGSSPAPLRFANAIFCLPKLDTPKAWLLIVGNVTAMAALIISLVTWPLIFSDPLDRVEFVFVWLAACIASNCLLSFLGHAAIRSNESNPSAVAQSAAV